MGKHAGVMRRGRTAVDAPRPVVTAARARGAGGNGVEPGHDCRVDDGLAMPLSQRSREGTRHDGSPALVLRHAGHGRANLVYRRADGHIIGWIDPPTIEKNAH
jgi:hypothetical protein